MENEFKIDNNYINEALRCAKNASSYMEGLDKRVKKLSDENINIINYSMGNVNESINLFNDINKVQESIAIVKQEALMAILSLDDFQYQLPTLINNGSISIVDAVSLAGDYMENLVKTTPNYLKGMQTAGSIQSVLRSAGYDENFLNSLSKAFCEDIIRKDLMYTREGLVEMSYNFNGFLAMYGYKLTYGPTVGGHFDSVGHGLYTGTRNFELKYMDCCNYYDWLCRCVGIDAYAYGAYSHYQYGIDIEGYANPTPKDEYRALSTDEYFRNGKPGDVVETNQNKHLRVIVENDGKGYLMTESTGAGVIYKYYEYDELGGYHVSNMDALFRNTSAGKIGMFRDTYGDNYNRYYQDELNAAKKIRGDGIFFSPKELAKELGLSTEMENELIKQYNKRNEHPNVGKIPEILGPGESTIVIPDSNIPNLEETITPNSSESTSSNSQGDINPSIPSNMGTTGPQGVNNPSTKQPFNDSMSSKPHSSIQNTSSSNVDDSTSKPNDNGTNKQPEQVVPSTPSNPVKPSRPTTPGVPSVPDDYDEPSVSVPNTPVEPNVPVSPIKNILPDNKFSNGLPPLSTGRLGTMEISKSFVNYEILNVNNETYGDYIQALLDQGYKMMADGSFIKDNYQIITSITQDGNMSIYLKQINL